MSEDIITKYNEFYTYYSIEDFEKLLNSQQRIDKAIEYIKECKDETDDSVYEIDSRIKEYLLSILKGEDKEC